MHWRVLIIASVCEVSMIDVQVVLRVKAFTSVAITLCSYYSTN